MRNSGYLRLNGSDADLCGQSPLTFKTEDIVVPGIQCSTKQGKGVGVCLSGNFEAHLLPSSRQDRKFNCISAYTGVSQISYSLKLLRGYYTGSIFGVIKGDRRRVDYRL